MAEKGLIGSAKPPLKGVRPEYLAVLRKAEQDISNILRLGPRSWGGLKYQIDALAAARRVSKIMYEELSQRPKEVYAFDKYRGQSMTGPETWRLHCTNVVNEELFYNVFGPKGAAQMWENKVMACNRRIERMKIRPEETWHAAVDAYEGKAYIWEDNPKVFKVASPYEPIDMPSEVEFVEMAISFIPYLGTGVAMWEIYDGHDLFGYRLTDTERAIMAATILAPFAGRLVKHGVVMYSKQRLAKMFGKELEAWTKTLERSGKVTEEFAHIGPPYRASKILKSQLPVTRDIAKEIAQGVQAYGKAQTGLIRVTDSAASKALALVQKKFPNASKLANLDAEAMHRVLEKGIKQHIKGSFVEEVLESYIIPWLRTRLGGFALGIKLAKEQLERLVFYAGRLIRTAHGAIGRQITDGIIGFFDGLVFRIVGIFNGKSSARGARDLFFGRKITDIAKLPQEERAAMEAYARDVWLEEKDIIEEAGKDYKKSVDNVMKELIHTEQGGQMQREIERLSPNADGERQRIRLGGVEVEVDFVEQIRTKMYSVVPDGVNVRVLDVPSVDPFTGSASFQRRFETETLGIGIKTKELDDLGAEIEALIHAEGLEKTK